MSGPVAEDAPLLVFTRIGKRAYMGHDPMQWPLGIDVGLSDAGAPWTVVTCGQVGCGATLIEVTLDQVVRADYPISPAHLVDLVRLHADECAAFRA